MPGSRSRSHRLLAAAAALAVVAAACGGGDGDAKGSTGTKRSGGATSTIQAGGNDGGSADGNTSGGSGGSGSTAGAVSSASTVPLQLTDLKPNKYGAPLPGRYLYDVTGTDKLIELDVRDVLGDQSADHFDRTGDLGQLHIEKEGAEARASLVQWTASGLFLNAEQRAQNTTGGTNESPVCDYRPDLLLQERPLKVGATWNDESTCTATQGDVTFTRTRKLKGEVLGTSSAQVNGHQVATMRLKRVTDSTTSSDSTPPLVLTEHREVTIEWIVAAGLAARVEGTVIETASGSAQPARLYVWALRSTTPVE